MCACAGVGVCVGAGVGVGSGVGPCFWLKVFKGLKSLKSKL